MENPAASPAPQPPHPSRPPAGADRPGPRPPAAAAPRIRSATAADLPAVTAILAHHARHGGAPFEEGPPDLARTTARRERLAVGGYPFLVAEGEGGAVLGYAHAAPCALRPAWRGMVEDAVLVHPEAAGRGVGRALLGALVEACAARGFRQMVAVIADGDAAAIGLHRAMGFGEVGVLRAVGGPNPGCGDAPVDARLMQRALRLEGRAPAAARAA